MPVKKKDEIKLPEGYEVGSTGAVTPVKLPEPIAPEIPQRTPEQEKIIQQRQREAKTRGELGKAADISQSGWAKTMMMTEEGKAPSNLLSIAEQRREQLLNKINKTPAEFPEVSDLTKEAKVRAAYEGLEEPGASLISTAAQVYDALEKALGNRKSALVQKAEASFTDATALIDLDIAQVKTGEKSLNEALRNFELATSALSRLEETTYGLGKLNLRYFLDNGKELEAQILRERGILENQRRELIAASQEARIIAAGLK